jgi:LytS/YehU family sensor histidine kinase
LQPVIENAIKHGIIPSEKNHKICLSFKQEHNQLIVMIDDDGIGRVLAAKNKPKNHQSKGISLIQKKIILLKERFDVDVTFEIIDKAVGTLVVIKLPIMK